MAKEVDEITGAEMTVATATRNVVESYIFATGHQDLSIYSERLLMQLVKAAQCQVAGLNFKDGSSISQVTIGKLGDALVEIEARELISGDKSSNYTHAKKAVLELLDKKILHERPAYTTGGKPVLNDAGEQLYQLEGHNLVNDVWINRKPGTIQVNVNKHTWEAILDFSKGFRRYDLQMAMKFSRSCSLRMYKLISNQKYPLTFTIQELRDQWGLQDKYAKTSDFIKYTIDSAKEELDSMSPWTFEYQPLYAANAEQNKGRTGRKSITSIMFFPKHQLKYESSSATMNMVNNPTDLLGKPIVDRLVKNHGFSMAEIKANLVLLQTAKKNFDLEGFLIEIGPGANRANNAQGYIINAIKKHLKEKCDIIVKKNGAITQTIESESPSPEEPSAGEKTFSQTFVSEILSSAPQSAPKPAKDTRSLAEILGEVDEQ